MRPRQSRLGILLYAEGETLSSIGFNEAEAITPRNQ